MKKSIVHVFPSFAGGGPEVRTGELINRTSELFRHEIISIDGDLSGLERLAADVRDDCSGWTASTIMDISKKIRSRAPDAVFTYGWGGVDAIIAARMAGIPSVVHGEDGFLPDEQVKQKLKRKLARRYVFKLASKIVVPSKTLTEIAKHQWGVSDKSLQYIPNGVDDSRFRCVTSLRERNEIRAKLDVPSDRIVIGTVGGLRPEKNHLRLVSALANLCRAAQDIHLMIVGDGPLADPIRQDVERRGILDRTTFCGSVADPCEHYRAMDVLAISSDTEQMPLALLEGMATGLPVAAIDVGDIAEMVADENRQQIVSILDPDAFVHSLGSLLTDSDRRQKIGAANRAKFLSRYTLNKMVDAYRSLYAAATNGCDKS